MTPPRMLAGLLCVVLMGCASLRVDVDVWTAGRTDTVGCVSSISPVGSVGWINTDPRMRDVAAAREDCWKRYGTSGATGWFGNTQFVLAGGPLGVHVKSVSFDPEAFISAGMRGIRTAIGVASRIYAGNVPAKQTNGVATDVAAKPSKASLRASQRQAEQEALEHEVELSRRVESLVRTLELIDTTRASTAAVDTQALVPELRKLLGTTLLPEDKPEAKAKGDTAQITSILAPPPGNVRAALVVPEEVVLQWDDLAKDETSYVVERRKGASGPFERVGRLATNATAFRDTGLEPATKYEYRVLAVNPAGSASAGVSVSTPQRPPVAPTKAAVGAIGHDAVSLSWSISDQPDRALTQVRVERRRMGEDIWVVLARLAPPTDAKLQYEDKTVSPRVAYEYRLTLVGAGGESTSPITLVVAKDQPARQPTALRAVVRDGVVELSWGDRANGEAGFEVQRDPPASWRTRDLPPDTESYRDKDVESGRTYTYTVRAFNLDREFGNPADYAKATVEVPLNNKESKEAESWPFPWEMTPWILLGVVVIAFGIAMLKIKSTRVRRDDPIREPGQERREELALEVEEDHPPRP